MWESIKQSLREYALAGGQWIWWLVSAILLLAEVYQKVTGGTAIPLRYWAALAVIALFVAPFIAFHKSRLEREGLKRDIEQLRDMRPKVTISKDGRFNLKVENTGGEATFEAKLCVLEARDWPSLVSCDQTGGGCLTGLAPSR